METRDRVKQILQGSVSMNEVVRREAFQASQLAERDPQFLLLLLTVALDESEDAQMRFLAMCCCRNVIGRLFVAQSVDTKVEMKNLVINALQYRLESIQNFPEFVVIIRKIVKTEFPNAWPELIDFLVATGRVLASLAGVSRQRYGTVLYQLVKEQESKKLMAGRKHTLQISPVVLDAVVPGVLEGSFAAVLELDKAIARLCRIGFLRFYEIPMHQNVVKYLINRLDNEVDGKSQKKLWKEIASLFGCHMLAFVDSVGVDGMLDRAMAAISRGIGREFPLTVVNHAMTFSSESEDEVRQQWLLKAKNQYSAFLARHSLLSVSGEVVERFLSIPTDVLSEWLEAPDDSLGGPLDGDEARLAAESFIVNVTNDSFCRHAISKLESCLLTNKFLRADAWLTALIAASASIKDVQSLLGPLMTLVATAGSAEMCLVQFRVIQLVRIVAFRFSIVELRQVVLSFIAFVDPARPLVIRLSGFFALKALFDRSSDDLVWEEVGPKMVEAGVELLSHVHAGDVVWRLLNGVALISSSASAQGSLSRQQANVIHSLFVSKDSLIRCAIIDLVKAMLATADEVGGVDSSILDLGFELVRVAIGTGKTASDHEQIEESLSGGLSLLIALIRVSTDVSPRLTSYIDEVVRMAPALIGAEIFQVELIQCLIEFDALAVERGVSFASFGQQAAIAQQFLQAEVPESVADECLALLEVIVARGGLFDFVETFIAFLGTSGTIDEDSCPLPIDSVILLINAAAVHQPEFLRESLRRTSACNVASVVAQRLNVVRLHRSKLRLVHTLAIVAPVCVAQSAQLGKQLVENVIHQFKRSEIGADEESIRVERTVASFRSNRFDSSRGMPSSSRRDGLFEMIRKVDSESTKAVLEQLWTLIHS